MAAVEAGKEIAWMRNILSEFGYGVQEPSTLKMDNQSAITVSKNPLLQGTDGCLGLISLFPFHFFC